VVVGVPDDLDGQGFVVVAAAVELESAVKVLIRTSYTHTTLAASDYHLSLISYYIVHVCDVVTFHYDNK
jgi:hypothetical protein